MKNLKIILALSHSDEVSGTYILSDGAKMFWTEGRSSRFKVVHPDGREEWVNVFDSNPLCKMDDDGLPEGAGNRSMTRGEEVEWYLARELGTLNDYLQELIEND